MHTKPDLIQPTSIKADLGRIAEEIHKFKPWMSDTACENWEVFLSQELPSFFEATTHIAATSEWGFNSVYSIQSLG